MNSNDENTISTVVNTAGAVASTAAFAIEPGGVIISGLISGGLTLFDALFNQGSDPLATLYAQLKSALVSNDIQTYNDTIIGSTNWYQNKFSDLKSATPADGSIPLSSTTLADIRDQLEIDLGDNSNLYQAVWALGSDSDLRQDGCPIFVQGASFYLALCIKRVEIMGYVNQLPNADLIHDFVGWSAKFIALAGDTLSMLTVSRRNCIAEDSHHEKGTPYGNDVVWTFTDSYCKFKSPEYESHGDAQTARGLYITSAMQQFQDAVISKYNGLIQAWQDNMNDWAGYIAPDPPSACVGFDPHAWAANIPQGTNWVTGNSVQYYVTFFNDAAESQPGPWCEPIVVSYAFPLLTNIPTGPMAVQGRKIYRQFLAPATDVQFVGSLTNNTDVEFRDSML